MVVAEAEDVGVEETWVAVFAVAREATVKEHGAAAVSRVAAVAHEWRRSCGIRRSSCWEREVDTGP